MVKLAFLLILPIAMSSTPRAAGMASGNTAVNHKPSPAAFAEAAKVQPAIAYLKFQAAVKKGDVRVVKTVTGT